MSMNRFTLFSAAIALVPLACALPESMSFGEDPTAMGGSAGQAEQGSVEGWIAGPVVNTDGAASADQTTVPSGSPSTGGATASDGRITASASAPIASDAGPAPLSDGLVPPSGGAAGSDAEGAAGRTTDGDGGNTWVSDAPAAGRPDSGGIDAQGPVIASAGRPDGGSSEGPADAGLDEPRPSPDGAIDAGPVDCSDAGDQKCPGFCASQPSAGLLVCDDFSTTTPATIRRFLPWLDMPSLSMAVSGSALVFDDPPDFSACYAQLGPDMDFRNTSIEATMSSTTEERSLSSVSWGTPSNLINAGLQRDEHALYLHFVVGDALLARLSAPVDMAPGQYQRVRMEVRSNGSIQCFVDDQLVLATTQDLSGLPRTLAPGVAANSYPPAQRFTFDDFVVRRLAEP
jgi:hypothetical protein